MMNKLKLVKMLVSLITFLLVFGCLMLFTLIYRKLHHKPELLTQDINLEQPIGSRIDEFRLQKDKLYILIKDGGESDRIIIFNDNNSKPLEIKLN